MTKAPPIRRLAAILAADVVGYSRLMAADEAGTLSALKARRKSVLEPLVGKHQGRVFKIAGDGALVEFASAVNAVQCAIELQAGFGAANADLPEDRRIVLRIGVHVGDVMVEGSDLYGDGVNIAARLEALAEPGGILVSAAARGHVGNRISAGFDDLGPQSLKNIDEPMRAFRVAGGAQSVAPAKAAQAEVPTIAVLPFTNMSGDSEVEFLCDSIAEDIISELSRFKSLAVVARNTSFQFRGRSVDIAGVGRKLGAGFMVEGSVRRTAGQIRIAVQLIDANTNKNLWAERFEQSADTLALKQDEITRTIAATLADQIGHVEIQTFSRKPLRDWSAYDYLMKAHEGLIFGESWIPVEPFFRRAIELDPTLAEARALLTYVLGEKYFIDGDAALLDEALELAQSAIALNPNGSGPHVTLGWLACLMRRFELAEVHIERSIELNPNNASAWIQRSIWQIWRGRCEEAVQSLESAPRVGQRLSGFYWEWRAVALFHMRRYQDVIDIFNRSLKADVPLWAHAIAALVHTGQLVEARQQVARLQAARSGITIAVIARWHPFQEADKLECLLDGLRKAGLPE